jgi:hypothetical protein
MVERLTVRRRTAREIPRNWVGFRQYSHVNVALNAGVAAGVGVVVDAGKAGALEESDAWGTDMGLGNRNLSPISSTWIQH